MVVVAESSRAIRLRLRRAVAAVAESSCAIRLSRAIRSRSHSRLGVAVGVVTAAPHLVSEDDISSNSSNKSIERNAAHVISSNSSSIFIHLVCAPNPTPNPTTMWKKRTRRKRKKTTASVQRRIASIHDTKQQ